MEPLSIILGLAQFAPQLIKWVTGNDKASEVAAIAVDVAQKVTGTKSAESAIKQLGLDPAAAAAFADKLQEREADLTKAYLADVGNARAMQVAALQQDDLFSKRFVYYFAIAWSLFAMLYFAFVTFGTVPESGTRMADTILGVLIGTVITGFFNFFFGSSARSAAKDVTIQKLSGK
jgi:hypothetical protein